MVVIRHTVHVRGSVPPGLLRIASCQLSDALRPSLGPTSSSRKHVSLPEAFGAVDTSKGINVCSSILWCKCLHVYCEILARLTRAQCSQYSPKYTKHEGCVQIVAVSCVPHGQHCQKCNYLHTNMLTHQLQMWVHAHLPSSDHQLTTPDCLWSSAAWNHSCQVSSWQHMFCRAHAVAWCMTRGYVCQQHTRVQ